MNRNQIVFIAIIGAAILLVVVGALINNMGGDDNGNANTTAVPNTSNSSNNNPVVEPPRDALTVVVQSSNTKEVWLEQMETRFNQGGFRLENGTPVIVDVQHTGSPMEAEREPIAWSPSNQLWVEELNQDWRDQTNRPIVTEDCIDTITMPIGIAMWRPMAEALGWPTEEIRWSDIIALATNPEGWASLGHPEWGQFRYGHGHPEWSNSGRLSIVAQIYASKGNNDPLSYEDIWSDETLQDLGAIQTAVSHYGRRDTFLLDRMVNRGPSYLHAVTNYEGNVIRWNAEYGAEGTRQLRFPLAMIYPVDGTFWENHPMCLLSGAEWASPEELEGARLFMDFISEREQQEALVPTGVRPAMEGIPLDTPGSPLTIDNGVIPTITPASMPVLPYPSEENMRNVIDMWYQVKKPATVVMLLDTSRSMEGQPLVQAVAAAQEFVDYMQPRDELIVLVFNSEVTPLQVPGAQTNQVGEVGEEIKRRIGGLIADGQTALYGAIVQGLEIIDTQQAEDEANGEGRNYAIVLLSDGENFAMDNLTESQVTSRLPSGEASDEVHFYTIAYGEEADVNFLTLLANRTNGIFYDSTSTDIGQIYFQISSEF